MPLDQRISFKTQMKCNRVVVPKLIRWQYKLEPSQVLRVTVNVVGYWNYRETFLSKMRKDGHLTIPKAVRASLKGKEPNLEGCGMDVVIEPA